MRSDWYLNLNRCGNADDARRRFAFDEDCEEDAITDELRGGAEIGTYCFRDLMIGLQECPPFLRFGPITHNLRLPAVGEDATGTGQLSTKDAEKGIGTRSE